MCATPTLLADLLWMGRLPESWVAPPPERELREMVRYRAKLGRLRAGLKAQVHQTLGKEGVLPELFLGGTHTTSDRRHPFHHASAGFDWRTIARLRDPQVSTVVMTGSDQSTTIPEREVL